MPIETVSYNNLARSIKTSRDLDDYTHEYFTRGSADKYSSLILIQLDNQLHRLENPSYLPFLVITLHIAAEVGLDKLDGHEDWYQRHKCKRDLLDPRVILGMSDSLARRSLLLEERRKAAYQMLEDTNQLTPRSRLKIKATPSPSWLEPSRLQEVLDLGSKHFPRLAHKRLPLCPPDSRFHQTIADINFEPDYDIDQMGEKEFRATSLPLIKTAFQGVCDDIESVFFNPYEKWTA